jgi:Cdc6-like AAA superfamily ATPase
VKREHLDAMEKVLKEEHVAIGWLDQDTRDLLEDAKELHTATDARASTSARLQEDINQRMGTVSEWEQNVTEQEQELHEKEEKIAGELERKRDESRPALPTSVLVRPLWRWSTSA